MTQKPQEQPDRQEQERHGEQHEHAAYLGPCDVPHPAVQLIAQRQQYRHRDGSSSGNSFVAESCIGAKHEGEAGSNDAGRAEVLFGGGLEKREHGQDRGQAHQPRGQYEGRTHG